MKTFALIHKTSISRCDIGCDKPAILYKSATKPERTAFIIWSKLYHLDGSQVQPGEQLTYESCGEAFILDADYFEEIE